MSWYLTPQREEIAVAQAGEDVAEVEVEATHADGKDDRKDKKDKKDKKCPQKPGTLLRIFIPAGAVVNLLGLLEVSSPSGICLIIRIPLFGKKDKKRRLSELFTAIEDAGGSVTVAS